MAGELVSQALARGGQFIDQVVDGACVERGFVRPGQTTMAQTTPGGPLVPVPAPVPPSNCAPCNGGGGGGLCGIVPPQVMALPSADQCMPQVPVIQSLFLLKCKKICDPCYLRIVVDATNRRTIAETKDFIGRNKLRFKVTGVTGATVDPEGDPSTLVADFPIAPGESIVLRQEDFPFPWFVGCLTGALYFSGGNAEDNSGFVLIDFFAGPKGGPITADSLGAKWNDDQWIFGSELRCGTACKDVPIGGQAGCDDSLVGELSELRMRITNKATASNNIERQQLWAKLAGLKEKCCDPCFYGRSCGCGK